MNESIIPKEVIESIVTLQPNYYPNSFTKIFSWGDLERLLNLRPFANTTRFKVTHDDGYTWNHQLWLSDINTFPPSLVQKIIETKACHFADSSRVNKEINQICHELESKFPDHGVDAHIYFNISENLSSGFGIHWDHSHNLIVQMEGVTRFQVWNTLIDPNVSLRVIDEIGEDPMIDVILNPGDAIFVPMYQYHRAISQSKRMSVSFPICLNHGIQIQDRHWIDLTEVLKMH